MFVLTNMHVFVFDPDELYVDLCDDMCLFVSLTDRRSGLKFTIGQIFKKRR